MENSTGYKGISPWTDFGDLQKNHALPVYHKCRAQCRAGATRPAGADGYILAGGHGSRLQAEKPLLPVGGKAMVRRVAEALHPRVRRLCLVANRPELYGFLGLPALPDRLPGRGPLGGLATALADLWQHGGRWALLAAGDMPWVSPAAVDLLLELAGPLEAERPVALVPTWEQGDEPLLALYSRGCRAAVETALARGQGRMNSFYDAAQVVFVPMEPYFPISALKRIFLNVNTFADWCRAARREEDQAGPGS